MPAWLIPAIVAGVQAVSSWLSSKSTEKANEDSREWNEKMYGIQRADALSDFNRQNSYNSPAQMMQRYKEAGLNANLVYNQSNTAAPVRSTDVKSWNPQGIDYSGFGKAAGDALTSYQDIRLRDEQVKNMEAQRKNMEMDSVLKSIQMSSEGIKNSRNSLELDKAKALYDTSIATAQEQLRSLSASTDIKVSKEVRDAAYAAPNLLAAFEKVANISADTSLKKQQISNLQKTGTLQQLEIGMRKLGMTYNDSAVLRMLAQFAQGKSLPEVVNELWNKLKGMVDNSPGGTGPAPGDPARKKWIEDMQYGRP